VSDFRISKVVVVSNGISLSNHSSIVSINSAGLLRVLQTTKLVPKINIFIQATSDGINWSDDSKPLATLEITEAVSPPPANFPPTFESQFSDISIDLSSESGMIALPHYFDPNEEKVTISFRGLESFLTYDSSANQLIVDASAPAGTYSIVAQLADPWGLTS
jgi:hypothetical protein